MDKAEADRHDKMLELAELLAEVLQKAVPSLSEQQVEEAGITAGGRPDAVDQQLQPADEPLDVVHPQ